MSYVISYLNLFQNIIAKKCTALDFEQYIQDNKTLLLNDPLRDILLYPTDDVSVSLIVCFLLQSKNTLRIWLQKRLHLI